MPVTLTLGLLQKQVAAVNCMRHWRIATRTQPGLVATRRLDVRRLRGLLWRGRVTPSCHRDAPGVPREESDSDSGIATHDAFYQYLREADKLFLQYNLAVPLGDSPPSYACGGTAAQFPSAIRGFRGAELVTTGGMAG